MFRPNEAIPPEHDAQMLFEYLLDSVRRTSVMGGAEVELITRENGINFALNESNGTEIIEHLRKLIEQKKLANELSEDIATQIENDIRYVEAQRRSIHKPRVM